MNGFMIDSLKENSEREWLDDCCAGRNGMNE